MIINTLEKDLVYLKILVEQVNSGEKNVRGISGVITRIENLIKELDQNDISHARFILDFRKTVGSIREKQHTNIFLEIGFLEQMINEGVDSKWSGTDICEKIDDILKKIKKIDKKYEIRHELYEQACMESRRFFSGLCVGKLAKELKEKFIEQNELLEKSRERS